MQDKKKT